MDTSNRCILACDKHLPIEFYRFECSNHIVCHTVVGYIRDRYLILIRGQCSLHLGLRSRIVPVRRKFLIDFLESSTTEQRIKRTMGPLSEQQRIVVRLGAVDHHCVLSAITTDKVLVVIGNPLTL